MKFDLCPSVKPVITVDLIIIIITSTVMTHLIWVYNNNIIFLQTFWLDWTICTYKQSVRLKTGWMIDRNRQSQYCLYCCCIFFPGLFFIIYFLFLLIYGGSGFWGWALVWVFRVGVLSWWGLGPVVWGLLVLLGWGCPVVLWSHNWPQLSWAKNFRYQNNFHKRLLFWTFSHLNKQSFQAIKSSFRFRFSW